MFRPPRRSSFRRRLKSAPERARAAVGPPTDRSARPRPCRCPCTSRSPRGGRRAAGRRRPGASSGSRSSTLSAQVVEGPGLEAEEAAVDPVLGARLLGKPARRRRRPSRRRPTGGAAGRPSSSPPRRGRGGSQHAPGPRPPPRRRRSRRRAAAEPSRTDDPPPGGVSRPVSTHSTSTPSGHSSAAANSSISSPL